jgi:hypothetical protein
VVGEDWARLLLLALLAGRRLVEFVVVDPDCLSGAGEPVDQHGGGGLPREPWIGAIEPERQTFNLPALPTTDTAGATGGKGEGPWKWFMPAVQGWIYRRGTPKCASGSLVLGAAKPLSQLPPGAR